MLLLPSLVMGCHEQSPSPELPLPLNTGSHPLIQTEEIPSELPALKDQKKATRAEAPVSLSAEVAPAPRLPEDLPIGRSIEVPVVGDRPLRVAHASHDSNEAIIYLHGMCGNSKGAEPWLDLALSHGTLIVVRADQPCKERPGYRWPKDPQLIQERIEHALALTKKARNGLLNTESVTLIGYSQGSHRGERLAELRPNMYPRVILGGPPTLSDPQRLAAVQRLAYLGGEREKRDHMIESHRLTAAAGINSRFFLLPQAPHGSYGPQGHQVMQQVFRFLYDES
ncbi:MAG: hypothetical protein MK135_15265 [Polyangiaceae bacterium]|nr:hypothetical protein [Polyangiaceae bacterium]